MATHILGTAARMALVAHGNQKYGKKPYECHLLDVVGVLQRFYVWSELPQEYIDAAWLHDTVEDTALTFAEIADDLGDDVACLVDAVTNPSIAEKSARNLQLYQQIRQCEGAINIKLADRIANVENCVSKDCSGRKPGRLFDQYAKAMPLFESEMRNRCSGEGASAALMWLHLTRLIASVD